MKLIKESITSQNYLMQDLGEIIRGASPRPKGDPRLYGGDIPRLTIRDVTRDGKFVTPCIDSVTEEGAKVGRLMPKGTLTLSCGGTLGLPSFLNVDSSVHDGFLIFKKINQDIVDKRFLYYLLLNLRKNIKQYSRNGGVFNNLPTGDMKAIPVSLIDRNEQDKVADYLESYESYLQSIQALISKMEQRNQYYLEHLVNGLMDEGNQSVNIDKKHYQLNKEWEVVKNADILSLDNTKGMSVKDIDNNGAPFFKSSKDIGKHSEALVSGEYLIFGTGGVPVLHYYNGKFSHSTHVMLANAGDYTKYLYYYWLGNITRLDRCFQGSGLRNLNKKLFLKQKVLLPPKERMEEIVNTLDKNSRELDLIKELYSKEKQVFQWLCEKLVSGEYRIEE